MAAETYKEWIVRKYLGQDNPRGDLAYDVKHDAAFPDRLENRDVILDHLNAKGACKECVALFGRTWEAYCKETGYQET